MWLKRLIKLSAFLCFLVVTFIWLLWSLFYFSKDSELLSREYGNHFDEHSFQYYIGITLLVFLIGYLHHKFVFKFGKALIIIYGLTFLLTIIGSNLYLKINYKIDGIIERADYRFSTGYFTKSAQLYYKKRHEIVLPHKNTYKMQVLLNKAGYYNFKLDGKPSKKIAKQFFKFQDDHNLVVDGILGKKTLEKLCIYAYRSELNEIKKNNDINKIKNSLKDLKKNDTIISGYFNELYELQIELLPSYIPKHDYLTYGIMFLDELKIQPENFTFQKIDSAFYSIILKNHNLKLYDQTYKSQKWHYRKDSIFIETLYTEFLDTLLKREEKSKQQD